MLECVLAVNDHFGLVCHVGCNCRQIGHSLSVVFVIRGLDEVLVNPIALLKLLQSIQHLSLQVAVLDLVKEIEVMTPLYNLSKPVDSQLHPTQPEPSEGRSDDNGSRQLQSPDPVDVCSHQFASKFL